MAARTRVLMLGEYPYDEQDEAFGGLVQSNLRLVRAMSGLAELDLSVLSMSSKAAGDEVREELGVRVIHCAPRNPGYDTLVKYRGAGRCINFRIAKLRPDLVHAQALPSDVHYALASGLPCVVTIHGIYRNELGVLKKGPTLKQQLHRDSD